ncbi:hypothetical protein PR003_g21296 [Phytophthora rubi]|uniref:RxLR effector protein n=2 Tax=Phytophthora rubi TaxID=129364 RepID=A0A6A4DIW0_9STRA|nr:hypothetical protein PR003_g21296 [Phytophthora rubi]
MKSVVTIAALLHVALNVLAVTDGAQPASSAPAVRSLRQSADMPTTEGDEEWMAHHQHHHHHVKKVKKIAIPVPVEVPQYIPVPVNVPSTVVANSNTAVVALEQPECLVHLERPEEHPERLGHLPPLLRQLRADVPQQPQLPRPAAQQLGAFSSPAGIPGGNNALGAGPAGLGAAGANGGGFPAAGGAFGGNPMGGFGAGTPMGGIGGGFGAGNRFGGGMLGGAGAGMSDGGFSGNGVSGFGAQGGNALGGQGAMGNFGPVGASGFTGGQAGAGFGGVHQLALAMTSEEASTASNAK